MNDGKAKIHLYPIQERELSMIKHEELKNQLSQKDCIKWEVPFKIMDIMGPVTYQLNLEDFTLPHRFQVESMWNIFAGSLAKLLSSFTWISDWFQIDSGLSTWSPCGPPYSTSFDNGNGLHLESRQIIHWFFIAVVS